MGVIVSEHPWSLVPLFESGIMSDILRYPFHITGGAY